MKTIKVNNKRHIDLENIEVKAISLTKDEEMFLVHQDQIGYVLMSKTRLFSYAQNLIVSNPDLWDHISVVETVEEADTIISNTLPNEHVITFND